MNLHLKALGACALAALVLCLPANVQAASFTASSYPASFTGSSTLGNTVIGLEVGKTECAEHFQGSLGAQSEVLTAESTLSGCSWFGSWTWNISMNGCDFRYRLTGGSSDSYSASTEIACPAGASIVIKVSGSGCTFSFPPQTNLASVKFTNNTAAGDISIQANVSGLRYVVLQDLPGCPFNGTGEKTGGTYTHVVPITLDSLGGQALDIG